MRKTALALLVSLALTGCGTNAVGGASLGDAGALGAMAKAGATSPAAVLDSFEALADKYVAGYDPKKADHHAALLEAADYENGKPSSYRPLTAEKVALVGKYLQAIAAIKLGPDAITLNTVEALKEHADYVFPDAKGQKSIYADGSAEHLRIMKRYLAVVKRYDVRQPAVSISRFLGLAYGTDSASEKGVGVLETYMEALDKAGFAVRAENFGTMNFSGRAGLDGLLRTMSFESGPGNASNVGPAYAKKALPAVLAALEGKKRTATADDVSDTLETMAWEERKAAKK
jgi:hypothetical protein